MSSLPAVPVVSLRTALRALWQHCALLLWLSIGLVPVTLAQPLSGSAPGCESTLRGTRFTGFFVDPARPLQKWHVQFDETRSVTTLTWLTHVNGRPVWYVTQPQVLGADGRLETPLYKQLRAPASQTQGEYVVVGRVALRWTSTNPARIGFRWRLDADAPSATEYSTCLGRAYSAEPTAVDRQRFGRWALADTVQQQLNSEPGILVGAQAAVSPNYGIGSIATTFDTAGFPVWLSASVTVPQGTWPVSATAQPLFYVPGTATPDITGPVGPEKVQAGTLTLAEPTNLTPHAYTVPTSGSGAFVSAVTGQAIQSATNSNERALLLPQTSLLQLQLDPLTCVVEETGGTLIQAPFDRTLTVRTLWNVPTCKAELRWNKSSAQIVSMSNGMDAAEIKAATTAAASGSLQLELTPSAGVYAFYLGGQLNDYTTQVAESLLRVVETEDEQAPAQGAWSRGELEGWNYTSGWALDTKLTRCIDPSGNTRYVGTDIPMRWVPNGLVGIGTTLIGDINHHLHSLDVQRRTVMVQNQEVQQWRLSMQLPARDGTPTWLQTRWISKAIPNGDEPHRFRGFLRLYRWNKTTRMRSAGIPVGMVEVSQPFDFTASAALTGLGMRVRWRINHAELRSTSAGDVLGCLHPKNDEPLNASRNSVPANSAYAGVWAGDHSGQYRAEDAMAVHRTGPSQLTEDHVLRLWDTNDRPIWLSATADRHSLELPAVEGPGSTALEVKALLVTAQGVSPPCNYTSSRVTRADDSSVYLRREFNQPAGGFWWRGRLDYNFAGVRVLDPRLCLGNSLPQVTLNWSFPDVSENPGALNTRLLNWSNPYFSNLVVTPRNCVLLGDPQETCKVNLSFAGASGLRIRRNGVILTPQALPDVGSYIDPLGPGSSGQHCYMLVNSNNLQASPESCMHIRNSAAPPGPIVCARLVLASSELGQQCASVANSVAQVSPGTALRFKLVAPPDATEIQITDDSGFNPAVTVMNPLANTTVNAPAPPADPPYFSATQTQGLYTYNIRTCAGGFCSAPTPIRFEVTGQTPAPPTNVEAQSPYPEVVTVGWNHAGGAGVTFKVGRFDIGYTQVETISGLTGSPHAFASSGGNWRFAVQACRGADCSAWTFTPSSQQIAASGMNPQVTPATSSTGEFTINWQPVNNTLRYEVQTASGSTPGTWSAIAPNVGPSSTPSFTTEPLSAGTYHFRVRGCVSLPLPAPLNVGCGMYAQAAPVTSTLPAAASSDEWLEAAPVVPPAPAATVDVPSVAPSVEVGTTPGEFRVDESGNATYSIPLYVAPATGNVAPDMALNYSSGGGDGPLGVGFSLGGMSSISRCRRTSEHGDGPGPHPVVQFDATDVYCLDGQRLIEVGTLSGYGTVYRTELDSFANIVAYTEAGVTGGPAYWSVWGKDGTQRLYGLPGSSHAQATCVAAPVGVSGNCNGRMMRNYSVNDGWHEGTEVMVWGLSKIRSRDSAGGVIEFAYDHFPTTGQMLLRQVTFSGTDGAVRPNAALRFHYAPRMRPTVAMVSGARQENSNVLTDVESFTASGQLARRYELEQDQSGPTGRPRLMSIREFAANGASHPATHFEWTQAGNGFGVVQQSTNSPMTGFRNYKYGDIDGDGRTDIVWLQGSEDELSTLQLSRTVAHPGGVLRFEQTSTGLLVDDDYADRERSWQLFDFNQDGRDDLLLATFTNGLSGEWRIHLSNGSGFNTVPVTLPQPITFSASNETGAEAVTDSVLADFDGDGLVDLMTPTFDAEGDLVFQIRYQRRASSAFTCSTGLNTNNCPYEFVAPQPVALTLPNGFAPELRGQDSERYEAFDANGDGRADLRLSLYCESCVGGSPTEVLRSAQLRTDYSATSFESADVDPTQPAEPLEEGGVENGPNGVQEPEAGQTHYWMLFTHANQPGDALGSFRTYEFWQHSGNGAEVSPEDSLFRVVDINGDSLADVLWQEADIPGNNQRDARWFYQMNTGDGFSFPRCAWPLINDRCPHFPENAPVVVQDYNGDGQLDIWVGLEHDELGCTGGGESNRVYAIALNGMFGTDQDPICQTQATAFGTDWIASFADLDGDGHTDIWGVDTGGNQSQEGDYRIIRHNDRYVPRDMIKAITNGLGAQTRIDYAPLTFSSVYRRDHTAPFLTNSGRGAPVFDLQAPIYVVRYVASSAPGSIDAPADPWVRVAYRYAGAKSQAGGRGNLGMRKVWSLDLQTQVESETSYLQAWPLNGRTEQSASRRHSSTPSLGACNGPGQPADGDATGCMARAPICSNNLSLTCDGAAGGVLMGSATDQWTWRLRTSPTTFGPAAAPIPASPASVFVYQTRSTKMQRELDSTTLSDAGLIKTEETVFEGVDAAGQTQAGYDGHGNLLQSSSSVLDSNNVLIKRVASSFGYAPAGALPAIWVPGLVTSSTVTTVRGSETKVRASTFEYDATGAVKVERIQPAGGASMALSIHTLRNSYGQPVAKISCSNHFSDAECTQTTTVDGVLVPANLVADPADPLRIRRFESYQFDATSRFVDATYQAFDSADGVDSQAIIRRSSQVLERNLYGEPTRAVDVNGVVSRTQHTALGTAYHSYIEGSGSTTLTRTDWCVQPQGVSVPTVACPAGAVYRTHVETRGTPTQRTYYDALGRSILAESQAFAASQWTATATGYDRLGRGVQQSNPYFSAGADRRLCGAVACTQTQFDPLGRSTLVIAPDDTATRPVRTAMAYGAVNCPVNGQTALCSRTTTTNPKNQVTVELRSALGEVAVSRDAAGLELVYQYDAHGNVRSVSRTPTSGDSAHTPIFTYTTFDDLGRRTQLQDPDLGVWTYGYNAAGEQVIERNANGHCVATRYDTRGRQVSRSDYLSSTCTGTVEARSAWVYDSSAGGSRAGMLLEEREEIEGTTRRFEFDTLSRPTATVSIIEGKTYRQEVTYDQFGRAFQSFDLVFAAGDIGSVNGVVRRQGVQFIYNNQGYQSAIVNAQSATDVYYEILSSNERGQVTQDRRGGHIALARTLQFDALTGRLVGIRSGSGTGAGNTLQDLDYGRDNPSLAYDVLGNLLWREDERTGLREEFSYDSLNRLTGSTLKLNGANQSSQSFGYDSLGNLMNKGPLSYRNAGYAGISQSCARTSVGPHMVTRVIDASNGQNTVYCYDQNGNQVSAGDGNPNSAAPGQRLLKYAVHDKPTEIRTTGPSGRLTQYRYGPGREITRRLDGPVIGSTESNTHYVGGMEITYRPDSGNLTERREFTRHLANYLIIKQKIEKVGGVVTKTGSRSYRFEDKLGSLDVLADKNGIVLQRMSFDVWGERRKADNWTALTLAQIAAFNSDTTKKGYTGHEEIDQANLIHMGGRVYDPRIAKFLSADPLIQAPFNTQSYNRYSYVLNNPMNYVDPSGYSWLSDNWRSIAAIAVSFYMPGAYAALLGVTETGLTAAILTGMTAGAIQTGTLKGALMGGFSAGMFHGIGSFFDGAGKGAGDWAFKNKSKGILNTTGRVAKIAAHGAAGGVMSVLQGGKFGHGFVSAGFGEAMSPAVGKIDSRLGKYAAGVVIGGTTSALSGGKFGNGAMTGAFQMAFNHIRHTFAASKFAEMASAGPRSVSWTDVGPPSSDDLEALRIANQSLADAFDSIVAAKDFGSMLAYRNARFTYTATNDGYYAAGNTTRPFQGRINFSRSALDYGSEGMPLGFSYHGAKLRLGGRGTALFALLHEISHLNNNCCEPSNDLTPDQIEYSANSNAFNLLRHAPAHIRTDTVSMPK